MPLYALGFMGMTRRLGHYANTAWQPYLVVAFFGAVFIAMGIGCQMLQIVVSIRDRAQNRDLTGDPWDGRTLEWSMASPPPFYNFAVTPHVHGRDAFWSYKQDAQGARLPAYVDIEMPKSTAAGFFVGVVSGILAFGLIWHIWWLVVAAFLGIIGTVLARAFQEETDYIVSAKEVSEIEAQHATQPHVTA
jgi:cytochrome o ubiquinol oxidase subunit 1